jgi:AraC-like DNA-binding protein
MLLFLSMLGILLSAVLLYFNGRKNRSIIYLGIFFFLVSLYCLCQYILLYSKAVSLVIFFLAIFAIIFPPLYLIGPMLYWYVRSVLTDNPRLKKSDIWHLLPTAIFFIAALPYTFGPMTEKTEAARELVNNVGILQIYKATILSDIFSVSAIYLSRPVLILAYTLYSIVIFLQYLLKNKLASVFPRQYFMTKWLCPLLGFVFILATSHILLIIKTFDMNFSELAFGLNFMRILSGLGLIGLLISPFFFPAILYGLPRLPEPGSRLYNEEGKSSAQQKEARKNTNHFESVYLTSIGQKADSYMKEKMPYLQPDFNLSQLSVNINIPVHHLGYFFREIKNQHFNDYRNEWRIKHAMNLIEEGKSTELTLEAVGKLSGFASRNSFTMAFKKSAGIPPKLFVARSRN